MTTVPVATGARLLGIHPKTLRHWLTTAHLPLLAHPTDARIRCVTQAALVEMARRHSRPLPDLSAVSFPEKDTTPGAPEEQTPPGVQAEPAPRAAALAAPAASLVDMLQQLAQLHTQVATLQHHLVRLTLELLPERSGDSQPLESFQSLQQAALAGLPAPSPLPERRLLPAEVRARSRVTALIEYGAHGQYVAVCPRQGVLSLVPDSPQWFDWLASLTSFRFLGPSGRFSAYRASEKAQHTRCWAARRWVHGHDFWHYLGVTDHLTLASLEQAAAVLQARVDVF